MESNGGESIRVFVRVRPPDPNLECDLDHAHCLEVSSLTSLSMKSHPEPKVFTFDHVAGMHTTQEGVFSAIGRPIIESCMCGYNGTIFAYGQTGSGKTFTMIGPTQEGSDSFTHELRGIIPRGFEYLFSLINREIEKYGELVEFLCKCSFLEIYNEQIFDLLDSASCGLHLRENMTRGVYVDGLTEQNICSARDAYQVLHTGWLNRRVASTSMNRESSRSHAVFTLTIESKKRETKESVAKIKTSLLNLVDLAGSERQRDTHTAGLRLKEAGSINKSLSALGNVIMALVDIAHGKSRHVHYRDSKLTFLLRDSLGGNAKTNLVANVHPSARCFGETLSTLNFAKRAKMIKNKAVVNEDTSGNVHQLQCEIRRLRQIVDKLRNGMAVSIPLPSTPEEGGGALLAGPSSSYSPTHSLSSTTSISSVMSDDSKMIKELREMLAHSMAAREKVEASKMSLLERVENLQKFCDKKDKFLQSTKMILKFRETHIGNMEKGRKGERCGGVQGCRDTVRRGVDGRSGKVRVAATAAEDPPPDERDASITLLQQEMEQLRFQIDHHPDITKFALENLDLRAELKKLRSSASGSSAVHKELARTHQYTLQLERQLRYYLAKGGGEAGSPGKAGVAGIAPRLRPQAESTNEVQATERLQSKCSHLQSELEKLRRQLATERDEFHVKKCKMEATLNTAHKANQELERSIAALKLKSSVERATLNDLHMNTIRSMLTPKRAAIHVSKSVTNTPMRRADSDPVKQSLDFTPTAKTVSPSPLPPTSLVLPESPEVGKKGVSGPVSTSRRAPCVSVGTNTDISGDLPAVGGLTELNIEGALTDELKLLQDANRHLQSQLEEAESSIFHLDREKSDLSAQLVELQYISRSEHEASVTREQDLVEKVAKMTATVADLTSSNTVLNSEVVDLRVCLQSADKELSEVKTGRRQDKKRHDEKVMECMQKIGELEQVLSSRVADLERQTEDLQNLQDEVETGHEELTFKDHRISELEQALRREKEHAASLTTETQCVLEKLAREVQRNTQLSSELQEGETGKQELVKALNENSRLSSSLTQLESDMKHQLQLHQKQTEEAQATITSLHNRQMADREAIGSLMAQLQELRCSCATTEAKVSSLRKELQDTSRELGESLSRNNHQTTKMESLQAQMKTMAVCHEKAIRKKDSEREIVSEELEHISEQYQQLSSAFAAQSTELARAEKEGKEVGERLALREVELARVRQKKERRASVSKVQSFEEVKALLQQSDDEKDRMQSELDKAVAMIGNYEQTREEKETEIHHLQEELKAHEAQKMELNLLTTKLTTIQYQLEEQQQREARLRQEMREQEAKHEQLQIDYLAAVRVREQILQERAALQRTADENRSTVDSLTDQLGRYKAIEQRLFDEKQSYQSKFEALQEEKAKLAKECANLAKENAAISGHQNLRQKIHYHASTKLENSKLREEVMVLENRLRIKTAELATLQKRVNNLLIEPQGHTPNSTPLYPHTKRVTTPTNLPRLISDVSFLKENIIPK